MRGESTIYCSFCGKSEHEVQKLIAGPTVFICNECIVLCLDIILEENRTEKKDPILGMIGNKDALDQLNEIELTVDDLLRDTGFESEKLYTGREVMRAVHRALSERVRPAIEAKRRALVSTVKDSAIRAPGSPPEGLEVKTVVRTEPPQK